LSRFSSRIYDNNSGPTANNSFVIDDNDDDDNDEIYWDANKQNIIKIFFYLEIL
jgi:hypothetical protein